MTRGNCHQSLAIFRNWLLHLHGISAGAGNRGQGYRLRLAIRILAGRDYCHGGSHNCGDGDLLS